MRLNRFIAQAGYCSRRKADILIKKGFVFINKKRVVDFSYQVNLKKDSITINGSLIVLPSKKQYLVLNKPTRYITSLSDEHNRKTVFDLLKFPERIFPIGRLDYLSSGVLLLTNDGDFAHKLSHPSYETNKIYHVTILGRISSEELKKMRHGINLGDIVTRPCSVKVIRETKNKTLLRFQLYEGRNRQIRRMLATINKTVVSLDRVSYAGITYSGLEVGKYRLLTSSEILYLKENECARKHSRCN